MSDPSRARDGEPLRGLSLGEGDCESNHKMGPGMQGGLVGPRTAVTLCPVTWSAPDPPRLHVWTRAVDDPGTGHRPDSIEGGDDAVDVLVGHRAMDEGQRRGVGLLALLLCTNSVHRSITAWGRSGSSRVSSEKGKAKSLGTALCLW